MLITGHFIHGHSPVTSGLGAHWLVYSICMVMTLYDAIIEMDGSIRTPGLMPQNNNNNQIKKKANRIKKSAKLSSGSLLSGIT